MNRFSRRSFLRSSAASLLAAPFVQLLEPRRAIAGGGPQRLLVFFTPNGTVPWRLWPETPRSTPS